MDFPKGTIVRHNDSRNEYESDGKGGWTFQDGRYYGPGAWVTKPLRDPDIIATEFTIVKDTTPGADRLTVLEDKIEAMHALLEELEERVAALMPEAKEFKVVGDRVRVKHDTEDTLYAGEAGFVTSVDELAADGLTVTVKFDSGLSSWFRPDELEHA